MRMHAHAGITWSVEGGRKCKLTIQKDVTAEPWFGCNYARFGRIMTLGAEPPLPGVEVRHFDARVSHLDAPDFGRLRRSEHTYTTGQITRTALLRQRVFSSASKWAHFYKRDRLSARKPFDANGPLYAFGQRPLSRETPFKVTFLRRINAADGERRRMDFDTREGELLDECGPARATSQVEK